MQEPSRKQSLLQKVKNETRSASMTNRKFLPASFEELKQLQHRRQALSFMNDVIENRAHTKTEFCKLNHISHHTLNNALQELGMRKRKVTITRANHTVNGTNRQIPARSGAKQNAKKITGKTINAGSLSDNNSDISTCHRPNYETIGSFHSRLTAAELAGIDPTKA